MEPSDVRYCYTSPVIYLTLLPIYIAGLLSTHLLAGNPDDWYVLARWIQGVAKRAIE